MADVVDTAGRSEGPKVPDARREVIQAARAIMRRSDATDDEYDDAIEALLEIAKER